MQLALDTWGSSDNSRMARPGTSTRPDRYEPGKPPSNGQSTASIQDNLSAHLHEFPARWFVVSPRAEASGISLWLDHVGRAWDTSFL